MTGSHKRQKLVLGASLKNTYKQTYTTYIQVKYNTKQNVKYLQHLQMKLQSEQKFFKNDHGVELTKHQKKLSCKEIWCSQKRNIDNY